MAAANMLCSQVIDWSSMLGVTAKTGCGTSNTDTFKGFHRLDMWNLSSDYVL